MQIETYEIEEMQDNEASIMAADGEAAMLVEKLGLRGQLKLANPETGTRLPYRQMTRLEQLVFGIHCPRNTAIEDYSSGIIPVRVLQVAALCREQKFFPRIEIWHAEDAKLDPVLVGRTSDNQWSGEVFLLARWGEAWKDFAQLVKEAKVVWLATRRSKFAKVKAEIAADEASLEAQADETFATGKEPSFCYS